MDWYALYRCWCLCAGCQFWVNYKSYSKWLVLNFRVRIWKFDSVFLIAKKPVYFKNDWFLLEYQFFRSKILLRFIPFYLDPLHARKFIILDYILIIILKIGRVLHRVVWVKVPFSGSSAIKNYQISLSSILSLQHLRVNNSLFYLQGKKLLPQSEE